MVINIDNIKFLCYYKTVNTIKITQPKLELFGPYIDYGFKMPQVYKLHK